MVKSDATTKSTLHLLDAEDELANMKLSDTDDPKTHLAELMDHTSCCGTIIDSALTHSTISNVTHLLEKTIATPGAHRRRPC